MKVYVLTSGTYSDYRVRGIFSSLENLKSCVGCLPLDGEGYNEPDEVEIDALYNAVGNGLFAYEVGMSKNGDVKHCNWLDIEKVECRWYLHIDHNGFLFLCVCMATSPEHAIKITNEKRAFHIASGGWDKEVEAKKKTKWWKYMLNNNPELADL